MVADKELAWRKIHSEGGTLDFSAPKTVLQNVSAPVRSGSQIRQDLSIQGVYDTSTSELFHVELVNAVHYYSGA